MTTPQSILMGLTLIALAIASLPYSNQLAYASEDKVIKVALCDTEGKCSTTEGSKRKLALRIDAN